jgi:nicotinate-nucleotide adenylyltransferase
MSGSRRLGLLGGTFDPIHFGHLDAAEAARLALGLHEVLLVPAHDPPHRPLDPRASAFHRFALVALAIDEHREFRVSDLEVAREGPSYTIDTLHRVQAHGWAASQIFFILGADAFAEVATWHAFPRVLDEAHFAVVARPGTTLDAAAARTPEVARRIRRPGQSAAGGSGTAVFLVEASTRDISSTTIRARLAARQPIDGLVPATVARHIVAHQLYGAVDHLHGENQRI